MTIEKKYDIHFYVPVRVKVTNVPGKSMEEAISYADQAFFLDIEQYVNKANNVQLLNDIEIVHCEVETDGPNWYLVDEVGDETFSSSRFFEEDRIQDRDVVPLENGQSPQFERMKRLLDEIAIVFQAGDRVDGVSWESLSPLLSQALSLMGEDRIADLELAEAYRDGDCDPVEDGEDVFVVVRYPNNHRLPFFAYIPEKLAPGLSKGFAEVDEAFEYLVSSHQELLGNSSDSAEVHRLVRVVLCENAKTGVFRTYPYPQSA